MNIRVINAYLSGLLDMASSASVWMGRSYADACVFEKDSYEEKLKKEFRIDPSMLEASEKTFPELIRGLFGSTEKADAKISDGLVYHIEGDLGEAEAVYLVKAEHLGVLERRGSPLPFYTVEDSALILFRECAVLLTTGNNE